MGGVKIKEKGQIPIEFLMGGVLGTLGLLGARESFLPLSNRNLVEDTFLSLFSHPKFFLGVN